MSQHELFARVRDHYAANNCALISVGGDPPRIDVYLKPGSPAPPLPPGMPDGTIVVYHVPKTVESKCGTVMGAAPVDLYVKEPEKK